jgi:hypothetical protein
MERTGSGDGVQDVDTVVPDDGLARASLEARHLASLEARHLVRRARELP